MQNPFSEILIRTAGAFSLLRRGQRFVVVGGPERQVLCDQPERAAAEAVYEEFTVRAARARARITGVAEDA